MEGGMEQASCFYDGAVMHRRYRPFSHRFAYRVFSLYVDLDELPAIGRQCKLLSHNRWNIMSFRDRDHGPRDGTPLRPWIEAELARAGIGGPFGAVRILCFPRLFGYVFNPISVWFCHRRDGSLAATLYEVSNTFGEHHCYLIPSTAEPSANAAMEQACPKLFYVSPFVSMGAHYRFRLRVPDDRLQFGIFAAGAEGAIMTAVHNGRRRALTLANAVSLLLARPLMTFKVIAAIHWQALRLWLKGARRFRRPAPPELVTVHWPARGAAADPVTR
jgi:hypothetical protein